MKILRERLLDAPFKNIKPHTIFINNPWFKGNNTAEILEYEYPRQTIKN